MTTQFWEGVPQFTTGQILSADGHLNPLARAINYCLQLEIAPTFPFSSKQVSIWTNSWKEVWRGAIRHKQETLFVNYRIRFTGADTYRVRIQYDGVTVWQSDALSPGAGEHMQSHTADISGVGLTVGQFYVVTMEIRDPVSDGCQECWIVPLQIGESCSPSYPGLAAFNDGDTPTAAQWQALSDYADALHSLLSFPRTPQLASWSKAPVGPQMGDYGFRYRNRLLRYQVRMKKGQSTLKCRIYVDNALVETINNTAPLVSPPPESEVDFTEADRYYVYTGTVDVSGLFTVGNIFYVKFLLNEGEDPLTTTPKGLIDYCYTEPADPPSLVGWNNLPEWAHSDYVYGSTTAKQVQDIKENLEWLGNRVAYRNLACRTPATDWDWGPWFRLVRTHRWLHYRNRDGKSPAVAFYDGEKWNEVSLPKATDNWMAYDLEAIDRLFTGMRYMIKGVLYCVEDTGA